ncbi:hypothetical protein MOX91_08210 [Opitutales bacterium CLA-KB-P66]|uniref:Uncharacterized protein n=1 Tax=Intestinicryptomonas porci TaxID=2926320 RepID=A0ABU4WIV8_9BACT|nr:hypothetical protein [Opitutales bacterium CLA-KB-P66]
MASGVESIAPAERLPNIGMFAKSSDMLILPALKDKLLVSFNSNFCL